MTKDEFKKAVRELADIYDEEKDDFEGTIKEGRSMVEEWRKHDAILAQKLDTLVDTFVDAERQLKELAALARARLEDS